MDTQPARYYAYFTGTAEGEDDELEVLVESWDDDGRAPILDQEEGRLVVAKDLPGFRRVERYSEPQVRGVLPGGNWRLRAKEGPSPPTAARLPGHRVPRLRHVRPARHTPSLPQRPREDHIGGARPLPVGLTKQSDPASLVRRDRAWEAREELPADVQRAAYGPSGDGSGGCLKEAVRRFGGGLPPPDAHVFNQLTGTALEASRRNPTVRRAMRQWSACMRKAGFDYFDALAAAGDRRWAHGGRATSDERATAERDVACKEETRLVQLWTAAESRIQRHLIQAHSAALRQAKARNEHWLAAARRVLSFSG
ncbi:hypothetical protein ACH4FX_40520 [Streptomyces sp. NPDC018019]|uniref:hypothetical protein n=1 Tax=Streptomyces sp. NPDC018019 TaxID=3365030 RepID=UPI0037B0AFAA